MKILVIQLTSLGDVYLSWPVIRALQREHPAGGIDFLVDQRHKSATAGLRNPRIIGWEAEEILKPLVADEYDPGDAVARLRRQLAPLHRREYDKIINLSFTPMSSYLTYWLSHEMTEVRGYSRHADGYLRIADDGSAYFFGQAGFDRQSRKHLTDVYADVAGVSLKPEDFSEPRPAIGGQVGFHPEEDEYVVCHIGDRDQPYGLHKWQGVISGLLKRWSGKVVLTGSPKEGGAGAQLSLLADSSAVVNLTGKTSLSDLFAVVGGARLLIGTEGAPVHIASFTGIPCLNLSFAHVSFWETGPLAGGSRVIWTEVPEDLASDRVVEEACRMLNRQPPGDAVMEKVAEIPGYRSIGYLDDTFAWELIQAIYAAEEFPQIRTARQFQALGHLAEINEVARQQLRQLERDAKDRTAALILDRVDEVIAAIAEMEPSFGPLVRWYQAEKSRLGPGPVEDLIRSTVSVHDKMKDIVGRIPASEPTNVRSLGGLRANR